jgi:hypothetical protein
LTSYFNEEERAAGNPDFDYAKISDADAEFGRTDTVSDKGFYILPSELFENVRRKAATDENLNETLEHVFTNIEGSAKGTESEDDLKGLFDDLDVNSSKLGATVATRNEKLVKLLNAIGDLQLGTFSENTIDTFGDAYEYLMTMYASSTGKSGGEFFTPQEVSELLARITVVVQNKLHFAAHKHTTAEVIAARADATKPNMGLTTWKSAPSGKIVKTDVSIAKNYLSDQELDFLNRIVTMYLHYAELHAETEFEKYRIIQDQQYVSDFDRFLHLEATTTELTDSTEGSAK